MEHLLFCFRCQQDNETRIKKINKKKQECVKRDPITHKRRRADEQQRRYTLWYKNILACNHNLQSLFQESMGQTAENCALIWND